jgi:hypothetical protein
MWGTPGFGSTRLWLLCTEARLHTIGWQVCLHHTPAVTEGSLTGGPLWEDMSGVVTRLVESGWARRRCASVAVVKAVGLCVARLEGHGAA